MPQYSAALKESAEPQHTLSPGEVALLQDAFKSLKTPEKAVTIAAQRLWEADRRGSDVDRIIDLCIGIEALVSGGSPGDTTYKISIRTAAVLAHLGTNNAQEVIEAAKAVYSLRSAVVHGRGKPTRSAEVTLDGSNIDTIDAARYFLRKLLHARLQSPELTPEEIDARIVGGALELWRQDNEARRARED